MSDLFFSSTTSLEKALDGSDETYNRYFFALYHCLPDEEAGINEYRRTLRDQYPSKSVPIRRHFILWGEPAYMHYAPITMHLEVMNPYQKISVYMHKTDKK